MRPRAMLDDRAEATGETWSAAEAAPRAKAIERGNTIIEMAAPEVDKLKDLSAGVQRAWIEEQADGQALFDDANGLIDRYAA